MAEEKDAGVAPVQVSGLVKRFVRRRGGEEVKAIDDVSMTVQPGEFVVLLGPSGCGKTTLLRSIAGLERPDAGSISLNGRTVFDSERGIDVPTERRGVSMIFQSYALWPHLSVFENVAYPLRARKVKKAEIADRVHGALKAVGVEHLAGQQPGHLSGGQQQRVALARAVIANDKVVLFDEPLSNVDAKIREQLRLELITMQAEFGFAALYVTHDQAEAMEMADRIAVLSSGKVAQLGPPTEIYQRPASRYVADFIGKANFVPGTVISTDAASVVVDTEMGTISARSSEPLAVGEPTELVLRPELGSVEVHPVGDGWNATIEAELFSGPSVEYVIRVGEQRLRICRTSPLADHDGTCWLSVPSEAWLALPEGDD